jgi:hypothetical protein
LSLGSQLPSKAEESIEPENSDEEEEEESVLTIRKLLSGGIELFVSYPPNIKNGRNHVRIILKNIL